MKTLHDLIKINHPIIMAPMFLVSNTAMVTEAMKSGIAGCIPALNYRTLPELKDAINTLKNNKVEGGAFGFNLIVNKSNIKFNDQLNLICEEGCDFIITSLGNPEKTIEEAHKRGIKVFCDVTNLQYAKKVDSLGADALIAVNNQAGGHRGNLSAKDLIQSIKDNCEAPIISAGGVSSKKDLDYVLSLGAIGVSVGSPFIASEEANISQEYKQACVDYGAKDIVLTERISGTPCTVINTPYVQKIGTKMPRWEKILKKNKRLKKYVNILRHIKGMKAVDKAANQATYKTLWVAGPTIENTKEILPIKKIINNILT